MLLARTVVLALLPYLCEASKRKSPDHNDVQAVDSSSLVPLNVTDLLISIRETEMPSKVSSTLSSYLFTNGLLYPITLAKKISALYDAFIDSDMVEYIPSLFTEFAVKGEGMFDAKSWDIFAQTLSRLNFEGWEELIEKIILKEMTRAFAALIKAMPNSEKLRLHVFHLIANTIGGKQAGSEAMIKFVCNMICGSGVETSTLLFGIKFINYLENQGNWNVAAKLRLKLIVDLAPLVESDASTPKKLLSTTPVDIIDNGDQVDTIKNLYGRLFREIEEEPALFNSVLEVIAREKFDQPIFYILKFIPNSVNDLMVKIVEQAPKEPKLYLAMQKSMQSLSLKVNLAHQYCRIINSAYEGMIFNSFLTYFQKLIIVDSAEVGDVITKAIQYVVTFSVCDERMINDVLTGLALSKFYFPHLFKEQLGIIAEKHLPSFNTITRPNGLFAINISDDCFPLEAVAKSAIVTGDVAWIEKLYFDPKGSDAILIEASKLMSQGFALPDYVLQYLYV